MNQKLLWLTTDIIDNEEIEDLSLGDKVWQQVSVMDDISSKESNYESSSEILIHQDSPSMKDANGKYPCDECEYQAGKPIEIKRHKLAKRKGLKLSCNFCQQGFSFKSNLIKHQKKIHSGIFWNVHLFHIFINKI